MSDSEETQGELTIVFQEIFTNQIEFESILRKRNWKKVEIEEKREKTTWMKEDEGKQRIVEAFYDVEGGEFTLIYNSFPPMKNRWFDSISFECPSQIPEGSQIFKEGTMKHPSREVYFQERKEQQHHNIKG
uniref:Uncharacterized protein n=1 Tax=Paramoeba aestuarina TaxID=180227 RepID=A0A7S4P1K9_9EUKA|mmetsp:Transcript_34645/g.54083  ORF Transcript_34645/g.54083 Transcript_34645/m.54083 type:complete len:131 (+) Transcript_34645:46-438(+)